MIINTAIFENYELAKENIRLGVRKVTYDNVVTQPYLDLETYAYIKLDGGIAKVNQGLLDKWGITKGELFETAKQNTLPTLQIESMREMMKAFGFDTPDGMPDQIVLKNANSYLGGVAMCFPEILAKAAEKAKSDIIIVLPSSIHEIICVAPKDGENLYEYNDMVRSVNASEVAPEEQLADHAYVFFDGKVCKI